MGMVLGLTTLGDENIARVLADPPLIWKLLAPDDPEPYQEARGLPPLPVAPQPVSRGWLDRLLGRKPAPVAPAAPAAAPAAAPGLVLGEGEGESAYLDKAWHGIHYLLTGSAWEGEPPLDFLVAGGEQVNDEVRVLRSAQVRAVNEALAGIDEAVLRGRFNPAAMIRHEIYPGIWDRDPAEDDTFGYCLEYFNTLKPYVAAAAARGLGLVMSLG
jgi:hypothetical protein